MKMPKHNIQLLEPQTCIMTIKGLSMIQAMSGKCFVQAKLTNENGQICIAHMAGDINTLHMLMFARKHYAGIKVVVNVRQVDDKNDEDIVRNAFYIDWKKTEDGR